jgi:hypothetical protein
MDVDLRFCGATWESVSGQRSAARLSKDTAKDGPAGGIGVDCKEICQGEERRYCGASPFGLRFSLRQSGSASRCGFYGTRQRVPFPSGPYRMRGCVSFRPELYRTRRCVSFRPELYRTRRCVPFRPELYRARRCVLFGSRLLRHASTRALPARVFLGSLR